MNGNELRRVDNEDDDDKGDSDSGIDSTEISSMADEILPASLEKLEIDRTTSTIVDRSRGKSGDYVMVLNPFGSSSTRTCAKSGCTTSASTTTTSLADPSYLFRRRSAPNRPTPAVASFVSPRGVKSTTAFKAPRSGADRALDRPRKRTSLIREAVLKLNERACRSSSLSESLAGVLLKEACRLSVTCATTTKIFGQGALSREFRGLGMKNAGVNTDDGSRPRVKDDTSLPSTVAADTENYETGSFQRARSNTMPSLKRPGTLGDENGETDGVGERNDSEAAASLQQNVSTTVAASLPFPVSITDNQFTIAAAAVNPILNAGQSTSSSSSAASSVTCSAQARLSPPSSCCDVTIDELASYFEEFVHIPKKMSHMAEMMYI